MAKEFTTEEEEKREVDASGRLVVSGMLKLYDTSSGMFRIRYPDGNRQVFHSARIPPCRQAACARETRITDRHREYTRKIEARVEGLYYPNTSGHGSSMCLSINVDVV